MHGGEFTIRPIDRSSREQYMDLCQYCFGMPTAARERYFTEDYELARSLGAFAGRRLAAGLWYFAFDMRMRGVFVPMAGLAAVATWPEYRDRGLARMLIAESQKQMRDEGRPLSVLQPFQYRFYHRMGWAPTFDQLAITCAPAQIRAQPDRGYRLRRVECAEAWETFEMLHTQFGARYNGTVCRNRLYWERRYFHSTDGRSREAYLVEHAGEPRGFLLGRPSEPVGGRPGEEYQVLQAVWLDRGALEALFGFLRGHRDQIKRVKLTLPTDINVVPLFDDPKVEMAVTPHMMTKLVDVAGALQSIPYAGDLSGELHLDVAAEATASWNQRSFQVTFRSGQASVTAGDRRPGAVRVTLQNLAELYIGYRPVQELVDSGELGGSRAELELLARAFPPHASYIDDRF